MNSLILGQKLKSKDLGEFSCSLRDVCPQHGKRALEALIPFATIYLRESGLPTLVTIKTKSRNQFDVQHDMRVDLSKTTPQFNVLIQGKQQQSSH
jgi:hypothetical protein